MELAQVATKVEERANSLSTTRRRIGLVFFGAAFLGLGIYVVMGRPALRSTLLAGVGVHLSAWFFRMLWRAEVLEWERSRYETRCKKYAQARRIAIGLIPAIGAGVALFFWFGRDNHGVALYITGIGAYVGVGILIRRWRTQAGRDWRWGPGILIGSTTLGLICLVVATVNVSVVPMAGVLLAMLSFPTGLALAAEDARRAGASNPIGATIDGFGARLRVAGGAAAVFAGLAGLSLAGVGTYQAIGLTVALVALVMLICSDTSHDIVLVLLAITLIWSLDPEVGPPEPDPAKRSDTIVALGDSYMSGEGANKFFEGTNHNRGDGDRNECRRAPTAYPVRTRDILAERDRYYGLLFLACSGAKAEQLTSKAQYRGEPTSSWSNRGGDREPEGLAQLPQAVNAIASLELEPKIVLISIGGNDAGFGEIGQSCGLAGDCSVLGDRWLSALETTRQKVRRTYETIKATPAFASSRFLVVPYPIPLNESGCTGSLLRPNEHRFLVGFTRALDRVLEEEAARVGFDYLARGVEVFTRPRRRICDVSPSKAAVNQLAASPVAGVFLQQVSPRGWFHNTFHPNERGHALIANEIVNVLDPPADRPAEPRPSDAPMTLAGIMGAGFDHCQSAERAPSTCHSDRTAWMVAAMMRVLWIILIPVVLIAGGAFLFAIELMRRWNRAVARSRS